MLISESQWMNRELLTLPYLDNDMTVNDVVVRHYNESTSIINFSSVIDIANNYAISLSEAMGLISEEHGVKDCIAIVQQVPYFTDSSYREAVNESRGIMKLQFVSAGTEELFDSVLEEAVERDLANNTSENTEELLEGFWDWIGREYHNGRMIADNISKAKDNLVNKVSDKVVGAAFDSGKKWLSNQDNRDKVVAAASDIGKRSASTIIDNATGVAKDKTKPYIRGAMVGAGAVAALGGLAAAFNSLTNQETVNNASPSVATRIINSLNKMQQILTGKARQAPPQQQGIFSKILAKIKWAIQALGRKVGLVK